MCRTGLLSIILVSALVGRSQVLPAEQYFVDETAERLPEIIDDTVFADAGDIDGDGDLDLIVSNSGEGIPWTPDKILINDGTAHFTDGTEGRIPIISLVLSWAFFADIERDGDLDFYIGNRFNYDHLFVNDGAGVFTEETSQRLPYDEDTQTHDVEFGDFDGDMDLDFILVQYRYTYEPNLLFLNDEMGHFMLAPSSWFPQDIENSEGVALGDIDGDFDLDVVIANNWDAPNRIWINDGSANFEDETNDRLPIEYALHNDVKMGDIDMDGDIDLLFVNAFFARNRIYINDDIGYFNDESEERLPYETATSIDAEFIDVDNDNDLDMLVSNYSSGGLSSRLYVNDGFGIFTDETAERYPVQSEEDNDMVVADFDLDGDADIFISLEGDYQNGAQNRLLINVSTPDSFPPTIVRTYEHPDTGDTTKPYIITSNVWDNISVAKGELRASLFYRTQGGSDFIESAMYDCGGFLFRREIPAQHPGTTVEYYVKAEDGMGNTSFDPRSAPDSLYSFTVTGTGIEENDPALKIPRAFSVSQNYPNPFNPSTEMQVTISGEKAVHVSLTIYDLHGKLVKKLVDGMKPPGIHRIHWEGKDSRGLQVSSGVYFYKVKAGDFTATRKMTLVR